MTARDLIQQAIGIMLETTAAGPDDAYRDLCAKAAKQRKSLTDTAAELIARHQ
ncbi:ANTAR domain-containing protein [Actinoplanes sp. NPDC048796]|uniref:ANTAR domain-containing protein n=1 Tax=Actinoplanes sp. NPDC048796 TaxID=3155640 RepID=UPI0033DA93E8